MQREIKFRFWDKDLNKMFSRHPARKDFEHPNIVPMQYTGLKDHKGVEIYEGDVCKISIGGEDVDIVEFRSCMFCFKHIPNVAWLAGVHSYTEVIGNIYANPELLQP